MNLGPRLPRQLPLLATLLLSALPMTLPVAGAPLPPAASRAVAASEVATVPTRLPGGLPQVAVQREPEPFEAEWSWPLDPTPVVLRPFEKPPRPWQRGHRGVDLAVATGADTGGPDAGGEILSPADGVVSFAGTVVDRGVLSIDHGGGRVSSFEPVSTDLVKGQSVREGDVVAAVRDTAAASGPRHCGSPCLHWGVRVDGDYVDPLGFVTDRRPSVLLPLEY